MNDINIPNRTLYTADNLPVLRCMDGESVDLIYLDPPFNTGRQFADPVQADISFEDTWRWSDEHQDLHWELRRFDSHIVDLIDSLAKINGDAWRAYLTYMAIRLKEMHRILKPTGSIYFHCDPTMSHGVKLIMDAIFGQRNFRNEIVWCYRGAGYPQNDFGNRHDILLRYSKTQDYTFNLDAVREEYAEATKQRFKHYIGNKRKGTDFGQQSLNPLGKHPDDWWQIQPIAPSAKERTGYPTQKPLTLLEKIIKASSNEGDVVLDPFCGCATACVAAEPLKRRWIGIDMGDKAVGLLLNRLEKMNPKSSGSSGTKDLRAFIVNWVYHKSGDKALAKSVNKSIEDWQQKSETEPDRKRQTLYKAIYSRVKVYADGKGVKRELPHRTDLPKLRDKRLIREDKFRGDEMECLVCGKMKAFEDMEVDHIIPKAKGGQDEEKNLQLLCSSCNGRKGKKTMAELVRTIGAEEAAKGAAAKKKKMDDHMGGKKS